MAIDNPLERLFKVHMDLVMLCAQNIITHEEHDRLEEILEGIAARHVPRKSEGIVPADFQKFLEEEWDNRDG